jgi:U3 small nucleolar RNA-associated protein MPP10
MPASKRSKAAPAQASSKAAPVAPLGAKRRREDAALGADPSTLLAATGVAGLRRSISALFAIGKKLTAPNGRFRYAGNTMHTDAAQRVTSEQVWGQLSVLMAPVMAGIAASLASAEEGQRGGVKQRSKQEEASREQEDDKAAGEDDGEEDIDAESDGGDDSDALSNEDDLDEKIRALLAKQRARKQASKANKQPTSTKKRGATGGADDGDAWRYALGNPGDDDALLEDDDGDGGGADDEETASEKRVRLRNRAAEADADDEPEEDEEGLDGGDDDDDEAALRELYGDDFDADGAKLGEDEEDEEGAEDDDVEGSVMAEDEELGLFKEEDGKYWGNEDILDDEMGEAFGRRGGAPGDNQDAAGDDEDNDPELNNPDLTDLQRRRLREERAIRRIEEARVFSAPWAMGGEAGASKRPKDSLLDEMLDFEHAMKAVPVVTDQSTVALEERIKQRIKNKAFDDVERRVAKSAAGDLVTTRKDTTIDSEKSKLSLMDLYEKEYLEKIRKAEEGRNDVAATAEPLTEIEKDELRAVQMWKRLAQHLDALSNFYYAPKPVQQDLDARVRAVEHQAPAIVIEAVGNFAASRAAALAPQDLYRHDVRNKFVGVTTEEMDPKEKRALRRAKKESFAVTKERKDKKAVEKNAARSAAAKKKQEEKASMVKQKKGK